MSKKYQLTPNSLKHKGVMLYQIQALKDIPNIGVKVGELGGYVQSEANLSQEGECWIHYSAVTPSAIVYGNAQVRDDAQVYFNVEICGEAEISGKCCLTASKSSLGILISDRVKISDNVELRAKNYGHITILDDAQIKDNVILLADEYHSWGIRIIGKSKIYGNAKIEGYCYIKDNSEIFDNAYICGSRVSGNAKVYGDASLFNGVTVWGNSQIFGTVDIENQAHIGEQAKVFGDARVSRAEIIGNAEVAENAQVCASAIIGGNAKLSESDDVFFVSGVGMHNAKVTFYKEIGQKIGVSYEFYTCWGKPIQRHLTLDKFIKYYEFESEKIRNEFNLLVEIAKSRILGSND